MNDQSKPSTPRTDAALISVMKKFTALQWVEGRAVEPDFARQLERELSVAETVGKKLQKELTTMTGRHFIVSEARDRFEQQLSAALAENEALRARVDTLTTFLRRMEPMLQAAVDAKPVSLSAGTFLTELRAHVKGTT